MKKKIHKKKYKDFVNFFLICLHWCIIVLFLIQINYKEVKRKISMKEQKIINYYVFLL